nr:MAG TPA: hypothetical protein [Caudoviricetes sp.]
MYRNSKCVKRFNQIWRTPRMSQALGKERIDKR